jgi:hypothetical protein
VSVLDLAAEDVGAAYPVIIEEAVAALEAAGVAEEDVVIEGEGAPEAG